MTSKETTSEEKLLKLIRKKNSAAAPARSGGLKEAFPEEAKRAQGKKEPRIDLLSVAPYFLMAAALGLTVYGTVQYLTFNPEQIASSVPLPEEAPEEAPEIVPREPATAQELVSDTSPEGTGTRDIFQAPWEKPAAAAPAGSAAVELAKNLKVVGILLDAEPKAIIEDVAMKQTFFVSPGEHVGGALLEEVKEDRVILIFNEERVELVP